MGFVSGSFAPHRGFASTLGRREDLEEIGLTRLQVRRLQALAKEAQKAAQEAAQAAAQEAAQAAAQEAPQEAAQEATQEAAQEATQEAAQEAAQEAQETQAALAGESADPAGESRTPPESEEHKELDIEAGVIHIFFAQCFALFCFSSMASGKQTFPFNT